MKAKIKLICFLAGWLICFSIPHGMACTIIYMANDSVALGGANEDWSDPNTCFWIIPPSDGNYGWIKFGFSGGFPQAGMNEYGLFWDASSCPGMDMPISELNKIKLDTLVMEMIITGCRSIEEACTVFDHYYCEDQYKASYLVGDAHGHSVIVEGDNIVLENSNYQILTNFYHSHPGLGGYPCWRYETAEEILSSSSTLNSAKIGEALGHTHQEGKYPTQYSVIYDLARKRTWLFYLHNYEEFLTIDLDREFLKGYRCYDIPSLFSELKVEYPTNKAIITETEVTFQWYGHGSSTYELLLSATPDFSQASKFFIERSSSRSKKSERQGVFFYLFYLFFLAYLNKNTGLSMMVAVLAITLSLAACQKSNVEPGPDNTLLHYSTSAANLEPGKRYYWKIIAHPENQVDFQTESLVKYFECLPLKDRKN